MTWRPLRHPGSAYVVAAATSLVFGAGDQYLGSVEHLGVATWWATSVSLMAAPWLALPFVLGWTQLSVRRAVIIGLVGTLAAVIGYCVMMATPIEGVPGSHFASEIGCVFRGEAGVIAGGCLSGPFYGWLGWSWRVKRSWWSGAFLAAAFVLEPVARELSGQTLPSRAVSAAEVVVGVTAALAVSRMASSRRRSFHLESDR